jgi:hypothetical protein
MFSPAAELDKLTDLQKAKLDIYWKMYNEHATQARHHETLRASVSTLLVAIIGALLGLLTKGTASKATGWFILLICALGFLLNLKHYERNRLHVTVVRGFRKVLDTVPPSRLELTSTNETARKAHEAKHPLVSQLRLHDLWTLIFGLLALIGFYFIVCSTA